MFTTTDHPPAAAAGAPLKRVHRDRSTVFALVALMQAVREVVAPP